MDLSLERWQELAAAERRSTARALAKELPSGFWFEAVRAFQLGTQKHPVALFRNHEAQFALVPGAEAVLGHDPERGWEPNPDELASWNETAEEYALRTTLPRYIAKATTKPRRVRVPPLLVETAAGELGWEPIRTDDPEVRAILRQHRKTRQITVMTGETRIRVRRAEDGTVAADRSLARTHAGHAKELAAAGYRLPTSDEWEHLCGAGSTTLFRWGDHVPCDRYPTDISPVEAEWRRNWVLSYGKLKRPAEGFQSDWDYHRCPNAFGLTIAADPYKCELVAEVGTTRGGDGGNMICGGVGFFVGWLTLATAYFEKHVCQHNKREPIAPGYTVGRRVLELG